MKRTILLALAASIVAMATSCATVPAPPAHAVTPRLTSTPNPTAAALDSGFMPAIIVPYVTVQPVGVADADELKISLPKDMAQPTVVAMPDGGALALGRKTEDKTAQDMKLTKIIAARYDKTGNTLWVKPYDELPEGYPWQVTPLGDGGFAFSIHGIPKGSGKDIGSKECFVACGADGHIAYREETPNTGLYQHILACDAGICAVGDGGYRNGKLAGDALTGDNKNALTILTQGPISSVFFSRNAKADGYFSPMAAVWSKETGLVVAAYKDDTGDGRTSGLLAYDTAALKEKWRYGEDFPARTIFEGLYPTAGGTLVNGYTGGVSFILKLAPDGKKLWQAAPDGGEYSVIAMNAFPDGEFAAAINHYKEDDGMRGVYLAKYDKTGGMQKKLKLTGETVQNIQPLDGGGLITVSTQNIRVIPAPIFISSIWYDTETIVTRYDGNLNVLWRKVYDRYNGTTQPDVAVATKDGVVIVEG